MRQPPIIETHRLASGYWLPLYMYVITDSAIYFHVVLSNPVYAANSPNRPVRSADPAVINNVRTRLDPLHAVTIQHAYMYCHVSQTRQVMGGFMIFVIRGSGVARGAGVRTAPGDTLI